MIRIKLAILEKDKNYLSRISSAFNNKLADKVELYTFTDVNIALDVTAQKRIDVLLASEEFDINLSKLPEESAFAYLTQVKGIDTYKGERIIGKYQKVDLIYKEALSLFSEKATNLTGVKFDNSDTKIITFFSCGGGAGGSTMAAACAMNIAKESKVIYLNLDPLGDVGSFFSGEGQFDISDVIYAIKSRRSNLTLKLESTVKRDGSGVFFYDTGKSALDLTELDEEGIGTLINGIKIAGAYTHVVIDAEFSLNKKSIVLMGYSDKVVFVSDGSMISNLKWARLKDALSVIEGESSRKILSKVVMLYNKFSEKTSRMLEDDSIQVIGGIPRYKNGDTKQIVEEASNKVVFNSLI